MQLASDARWQLVQRIAASSYFAKSIRLRKFLTYVCEKALTGSSDRLREQHIGHFVFGRAEDYDVSKDNIVRVEARELRNRLEAYFASEGIDERMVLSIPKGHYTPYFELREKAVREAMPRQAARNRWTGSRLWLILILIAAGAIGYWVGRRSPRLGTDSRLANPPVRLASIWPQVVQEGQQTLIVLPDASIVLLQELSGLEIGLSEYISREYVSRFKVPGLFFINSRRYTNALDVSIATRLIQMSGFGPERLAIRFARDFQVADFAGRNVVLLGSSRSTPWTSLFSPWRHFRLEYNSTLRRPYVLNVSPEGSEQREYVMRGQEDQADEAYACIAFFPNLRRTGNVVIIEGTTSEATQAAGQLIVQPTLPALLQSHLTPDSQGRYPYFEVLLKTSILAGTAKEPVVVACRLRDPSSFSPSDLHTDSAPLSLE